MTRVVRFVAAAVVIAGFTACANPTAPTSAKCSAKQGSACANVDFVNPNVDFVNPNV